MNSWKVILATVVIFGAGVLTGALVTQFSPVPYGQRHPHSGMGFGSPGGMRLEFLRRMTRDLDLSVEQRERIDKVMKQSQERSRKIMEPVAPQLHQELQRAKAEFREVLTPAQQGLFDNLLKQQQHFKERHLNPRPEPTLTNATAPNQI